MIDDISTAELADAIESSESIRYGPDSKGRIVVQVNSLTILLDRNENIISAFRRRDNRIGAPGKPKS